MSLLHYSPEDLLEVGKLTPIAQANLLATGLTRFDYKIKDIARWMLNIGQAFEDITPEKIGSLINKERIISGFPEVTDNSLLEEVIQERRQYYRQTIRFALDSFSLVDRIKAITQAITNATDNGEMQSPVLLADLVDLFEVEAQRLLEHGEKKINTLVDNLYDAFSTPQSDSDLDPMVKELIRVVKTWDTIAQPIQVSRKSLGLEHNDSYRIAMAVRKLAIYMVSKHGKINFAKQLTQMLLEAFAEVEEIAEVATEDAKVLGNKD